MAIIYRSLRLIVIMTFALGGGAIDASGQALITYDLVGVTFGSNITVSGSFTLDYACAQTRNICISNVNLTVTGIVGDPVTDQSDITYDPSPAGGGGTNVCDQFLSFCSYTSFAFHAKDGNDQLSLSAPLNTDLRNTIILSSVAPAASAGSYDHNLKQFGPLTGGKLVPRGVCEVTLPNIWAQNGAYLGHYWGQATHDHSYYTEPPPWTIASALSRLLELTDVAESCPIDAPLFGLTQTDPLLQTGTLENLRNQINLCPVFEAIGPMTRRSPTACPDGGPCLSIYDKQCLNPELLGPSMQRICSENVRPLELRLQPSNSSSNVLIPRKMSQVGCALTSLAMCLKFAHVEAINTTDPSSPLTFDPGWLDEFMSNRIPNLPVPVGSFSSPGGSFSDAGDVAFEETTTKISRNAFPAATPAATKSLQFKRSVHNSLISTDADAAYAVLHDALCNKHVPIIVGVSLALDKNQNWVPGHYVVVTKELNTTVSYEPSRRQYEIADPAIGDKDMLDKYSVVVGSIKHVAFETRGSVIDPSGDMSSLSFVAGDNAEILVTDQNGARTGFDPTASSDLQQILGSSYARDSLDDDENGGQATGVTHTIYISTPAEGTYQVSIIGQSLGRYSLSVRGYAQDGTELPPISLNGLTDVGSTSAFQVQFSSSGAGASHVTRMVTFDGTLNDLKNAAALGWINRPGIVRSLLRKLEEAAEEANQGDKEESAERLRAFEREAVAQTGKHIAPLAEQILVDDATSLLKTLGCGRRGPGCRRGDDD